MSIFRKKKQVNPVIWAAGLGAGALAFRLLRAAQIRRISFRGQVVVITGGSRGLGLEMARLLAREGARLALIARNEPDLQAARQELSMYTEVLILPCDVGKRAEIEEAIQMAAGHYRRIDMLINNAGVIQVGPLEHMRVEDFEAAMAVHFWGPLYAMMAALPYMRRRGGGRIVNISSIGGSVALPHMAPYVASKFALVGLSDAFRAELAREGIRVTTVSPGLIRTGSYYQGNFKGQNEKEFAWFARLSAARLTTINSRRAAAQVLDAARAGVPRRTLNYQARLLELADRIFPGLVAWGQKRANQVLPAPAEQDGETVRTGFESRSSVAPSPATRLGDQAAERNNEMLAESNP